MKTIRLVLLVVLAVNFLACKPTTDNKRNLEKVDTPVNLSTINLDIKGMTCQIGCAKTIESKISKLEGVSESKVSFEEGKGVFVVDTNKTSKETLITTINSLVGGETYTATESENNTLDKECVKPCCATEGKSAKVSEESCSNKSNESCDVKEKTACSNECADKCDHKQGESCADNKELKKKESCEVGCKKACC